MQKVIEPLGKESPYSTVKKGQQKLRGGERALRMMDGLAAPKMPPPEENVKVMHTMVMCYRRPDLRSIASEVGISFGQYNQS